MKPITAIALSAAAAFGLWLVARARANPVQQRPMSRPRRAGSNCCDGKSDNYKVANGTYSRWRGPALSYREAHAICWTESKEAVENDNDYSKPADRRCALGKMHAMKRDAWIACRSQCPGAVGNGLTIMDDGGDSVVYLAGAPQDYYVIRADAANRWTLSDRTHEIGRPSQTFDLALERARILLENAAPF